MPDPIALGRSVVVGAGQGAPGEWSSRERIRVASIDPTTADELGAAWRDRRSVVIELQAGLGLDDPAVPPAQSLTGSQPWEWPVDLDLVGERLHHALWANSVDARSGAASRHWRWAEVARRLGASPAGPRDTGADVILPDGTAAVCDGGPLDADLHRRIGRPVVHRISLEHRSLLPIGTDNLADVALAPDQLAAVAEPRSGARIIAPAGSGKTRVLTERARLLLNGWSLPPAAVALVAYNTRAAGEMRERLSDVAQVRVRTLNALGLRLSGRASTIEEPEVRRMLGRLVTFPRRAEADPVAPWIEALGRVRLGLADPAVVESEQPDVSDLDRVARAYRAELAGHGVVDFDEQVTAAIERLLADPTLRLRTQRFARVLLVDEFQDLTPAHLLLIRLLTGPAGAVFGVGDDDQTIYGYAGATPRWLVDFGRWFPGSAMHSLEVNYRCPGPVVTAASNLLTRNALRVGKVIRASAGEAAIEGRSDAVLGGTGTGGPGGLSVLSGGVRPATRSADRVRDLLDAGVAPADVAVLARVNASLAPVQVLLRNSGVPVSGGVTERFLQRGGVRATLAWLSVATAPSQSLPGPMLREAARRPKRGMSTTLLDLVGKKDSVGALQGLSEWLEGKGNQREADKVRKLSQDVASVRRAAERGTTADVLAVLRSRIGDGGLDASATALDQWSHGAVAAHGDDLDALTELADLQPDPARFAEWLGEQLGGPGDAGGVVLASIHAVKGREWPHVVVHHVTAGLLPHRLSDDAEEERRVFHVALTRCRSSASVVSGSPPSPFLLELNAPGVPPLAEAMVTAEHRGREVRARAAPPLGRPGPKTEVLPGSVGSRFAYRGHDHEVVELTDAGVRSLVGGGPATTTIPFGTSVTADGRAVVLVQPRFAQAWDRLRAWRTERAAGKPAYVVFDDKTLWTVAALLPVSDAGLLAINGIGEVKLESYGDDLISIAEELRCAPLT
jgi:DNA helicase-2/ATP-dependent DNA helicase PcrA